MTSLAHTASVPRYGSPAEVAAGRTVHQDGTVRRVITTRPIPAYRIGRRVLVEYRNADQFVRQSRSVPTMAIVQPAETPLIDPTTGKLRPLSDEEHRACSEALHRGLEEIDSITDETDTDEVWDEVFRGLAAARPPYPPGNGDS
jgi:hypothetical protein